MRTLSLYMMIWRGSNQHRTRLEQPRQICRVSGFASWFSRSRTKRRLRAWSLQIYDWSRTSNRSAGCLPRKGRSGWAEPVTLSEWASGLSLTPLSSTAGHPGNVPKGVGCAGEQKRSIPVQCISRKSNCARILVGYPWMCRVAEPPFNHHHHTTLQAACAQKHEIIIIIQYMQLDADLVLHGRAVGGPSASPASDWLAFLSRWVSFSLFDGGTLRPYQNPNLDS